MVTTGRKKMHGRSNLAQLGPCDGARIYSECNMCRAVMTSRFGIMHGSTREVQQIAGSHHDLREDFLFKSLVDEALYLGVWKPFT